MSLGLWRFSTLTAVVKSKLVSRVPSSLLIGFLLLWGFLLLLWLFFVFSFWLLLLGPVIVSPSISFLFSFTF